VVVAVIAMGMMKVIPDEIIDVIAMRNGLVSATWAMFMLRLMTGAAMIRRAAVRVRRGDFDRMLIHLLSAWMMQVAVMKIIDVIAVTNSCMAAVWAMLMGMVGMRCWGHETSSLGSPCRNYW
jgi:hypothetical protein